MMRMVGLVFLLAVAVSTAQQPIPNGGFEAWQLYEGSGAFKDYEEPTDGWSSGNGAIHVAPNADPVCEKTTDAHSGAFAAKMTTRTIFGQIASGSLFTGRFQLNLGNPVESARLGMPYTDIPKRFTGFYKYLPVGGDSAVIRATFRRWTGSGREVVAEALLKVYGTVDVWTPFVITVPTPTSAPDTVEVVFAASAGGEFFKGDPGSTLFIDDVAFDNASSVTAESAHQDAALGQWIDALAVVRFNDRCVGLPYRVVDVNGVVVREGVSQAQEDLSALGSGIYGIQCDGRHLMFVR